LAENGGRLFGRPRQTLEELKSTGLSREGGTKYLQAQLSIAYAAGEMPFESRDFIYNECPNSDVRLRFF
jgi:hypothetical protein